LNRETVTSVTRSPKGHPSFLPELQEGEAQLASGPVVTMSRKRRLIMSALSRLGIGEPKAQQITVEIARLMLRLDRYLRNPDYLFLSENRPASYFSPMHWHRHSFMENALKKLPLDVSVIDVGAGTKPYLRMINTRTTRYCAQDLTPTETNKVGVEQARVDFVSSAERMPLPDDSFDYAICTDVLEHVISPSNVMKEISRILKPGGKAIVTVPMICGEHQQPWHFQNFTRYGMAQLSYESGLVMESISPRGGYGSVLAALIRFMPGNLLRGYPIFLRIPLLLLTYLLSPLTAIVLPFLLIPLCRFLGPPLRDVQGRLRASTSGYGEVRVATRV
jgi:SAM-dependent methyltransferase